jgi:hypothetical protein
VEGSDRERECCVCQSVIWGDDTEDLSDGLSVFPLARTIGVEPDREIDEARELEVVGGSLSLRRKNQRIGWPRLIDSQ